MKIVEKKCPNCGANLEFKKGDTEVVCEYCKKKYLIEDNKENKDFPDYNLVGTEATNAIFKGAMVTYVIIFIAVIFVFGIVIFGINSMSGGTSAPKIVDLTSITETTKKNIYIESKEVINNYSQLSIGTKQVEAYKSIGYYLFIDKYGNTLYDVYKGSFEFSDGVKDVYIAVGYSNISNANSSFNSNLLHGEFVASNNLSDGKVWMGFLSNEELYEYLVSVTSYEKIYADDGLFTK
jgi:DNA-directed RNA polymerase subunit RPC12/RpoP